MAGFGAGFKISSGGLAAGLNRGNPRRRAHLSSIITPLTLRTRDAFAILNGFQLVAGELSLLVGPLGFCGNQRS